MVLVNKKTSEIEVIMLKLGGAAGVLPPGSAGLSWLVVYRHSLFYGLKRRVSKQTNISSQQSWS
jgi:hypothetical protein